MAIIIKYEILPKSESQAINKWVRITIDMLCEEDEVPAVDEFIAMMDVETFNGKIKIQHHRDGCITAILDEEIDLGWDK